MGGRGRRKGKGKGVRDDPPGSRRRVKRGALAAGSGSGSGLLGGRLPASALRRARFDIDGLDIVVSPRSRSPRAGSDTDTDASESDSELDSDSDDSEAAVRDFLANVEANGGVRDSSDDDDQSSRESSDDGFNGAHGRVPRPGDVVRWLSANPLSDLESGSGSDGSDGESESDYSSSSDASTSSSTRGADPRRRSSFPVSDGQRHRRHEEGAEGSSSRSRRRPSERRGQPRYDPGEKRRLKRVSVVERRAAKSGIGADLGLLRGQLEACVQGGADLWCSPPLKGTLDRKLAASLCACFGMEGSVSRVGKRAVLTARPTHRTCVPEPGSEAAQRLEALCGVGLAPQRKPRGKGKGHAGGGGAHAAGGGRREREEQLREMGVVPARRHGKGRDRDGLPGRLAQVSVGSAFVSGGRIVDPGGGGDAGGQSSRGKAKRGPAMGPVGGEFGAFTAHTTGFGAKMMAKLGYAEGRGIGARGDGIAEPVEAHRRSGRLGLGLGLGEGGR